MGQRVKKEIKKIMKQKKAQYIKTYQMQQKSVLRCKFIVISVFSYSLYGRKQERSQISFYNLKELTLAEKKEITRIRAEIKRDQTNNRGYQQTQSWFFEKVNKVDKPLFRLINKRRGPK